MMASPPSKNPERIPDPKKEAFFGFHPLIVTWFEEKIGCPTDVQTASWPALCSGEHALIAAPTGSGKTFAAFLASIDSLFKQALANELIDQTQILYISPLKALGNDVQKNLRRPLQAISTKVLEAGFLLPDIRVEVRTGDTPTKIRQEIIQRPPHILITTPESFFLLLTARKSREILRSIRTVIVDEIHALAGNKRGSHLALSLARLQGLCPSPPNRIGLSATQRPLEDIAQFLVGGTHEDLGNGKSVWRTHPCHIVNMGQHRTMDVAIETPSDELGAIATNAIWADIYDRLTALVQAHRSTLVFVNTRRLAERIAHHLTERLGEEQVATHHGSLSRNIRLSAEERLKSGKTRVVIATASLELGIDIGFVDLVCQVGSPRSIATCLQRIGRAGHWVGAIPKGRLFCTTRDELMECAALIRSIRKGILDHITIPQCPKDILAQQVVAEVAAQDWSESALFELVIQAYPYRTLSPHEFDEVLNMVAEGFIPHRGKQQAFVFRDRVHHQIRPRRGARLAAITSGGAIPDTATYKVVAEPQGITVGSVDEDFAVESLAGDIILLGNTSWRIRGIETGVMRVEDAHGAPPTIPFWRGEAPSRTFELSREVADLRRALAEYLSRPSRSEDSSGRDRNDEHVLGFLQAECGVDPSTAGQLISYLQTGRQSLGAVPTQQQLIAERFFDEAGGMQLVIHSPFGGRINRAWGLALRKRFCVNFDFELQAAATDEGFVLSLGEKHSFPLEIIWSWLHSNTVEEVLTQAILQAPMFLTRWRWNASRALALLRFRNGKRIPLHLQRMRAEDLLTAIFPMATACQDNRPPGNIDVPRHPLVQETIRDCLEEALDIHGLVAVLKEIEGGKIQCLSIETPAPSPFSHEILNANPYAFLDNAPLEERRSRAVTMRQMLPPEEASTTGALDAKAIATVCQEAWPVVRNSDELQEVLHLLIWVPEHLATEWHPFLQALVDSGRALILSLAPKAEEPNSLVTIWTVPEHLSLILTVFPQCTVLSGTPAPALNNFEGDISEGEVALIRSWMEILGPITTTELSEKLGLPPETVEKTVRHLEREGQVLRGTFRGKIEGSTSEVEWCDRQLLARIHRRTIVSLRRDSEPVSASDFMRFLLQWQHVSPSARLHGENGLQHILEQLAGFEAAASAWEPHILASRMAAYHPEHLDVLCFRGIMTWGRLTPPTLENGSLSTKHNKRIIPTSLAPISLFPREAAEWLLPLTRRASNLAQLLMPEKLSPVAQTVYHVLREHGASFFLDLVRGSGHLQAEVEHGLWELVSAGLVTADGFDNLRALLDSKRRRGIGRYQKLRPRHSVGRWSLLSLPPLDTGEHSPSPTNLTESWARQLLKRYGIVFRDLLNRESLALPWRELLIIYRQLELRGEIRGGRFVSGFTGEQFALPEAVESLRAIRKNPGVGGQEIRLCGSDPLNLAGIILPGERIPSLPSQTITFCNGLPTYHNTRTVASA